MMKAPAHLGFLLLLLLAGTAVLQAHGGTAPAAPVLEVEVRDFIGPATAELVGAAVENARGTPYSAILLTLDTFGGSVDAMFRVIEHIQSSPVPVIGYVSPAGRQALSAGTFILLATDYAAMAPFTSIGSAQPVLGSTPVNDTKTINALTEKLEGLARLHDRNVTQAIRFVTHNDNLSPEEALANHVVEGVAGDIDSLLAEADGRTVQTLAGARVLSTAGAGVERLAPSIRVVLIGVLTDPVVSALLTGIGFLALILGFTSPGWGAEVTGVVLLLLGLIGQVFNVNFVALALMAIGAGLLVFELYTPSFGIAGVGGILVLGVGMALMVTQPVGPVLVVPSYFTYFVTALAGGLALSGALFGFLLYKVVRVTRLRRVHGAYPQGEGRAVDQLGPDRAGFVVVAGEYWQATARAPVAAGERIRVVGREGKVLLVERLTGPGSGPS
jgi:membrane-bound serine protease (ClpP class)